MTTRAAARVVVAAVVAAAVLGAGVATSHRTGAGPVRADGPQQLDAPPGHPIDIHPACPNCFI